MKPVVINITNLIGTLVIVGDKESASAQIQKHVNDALLKVVKSATASTIDPSRAESKNDACNMSTKD
jgi:hypothetical protein